MAIEIVDLPSKNWWVSIVWGVFTNLPEANSHWKKILWIPWTSPSCSRCSCCAKASKRNGSGAGAGGAGRATGAPFSQLRGASIRKSPGDGGSERIQKWNWCWFFPYLCVSLLEGGWGWDGICKQHEGRGGRVREQGCDDSDIRAKTNGRDIEGHHMQHSAILCHGGLPEG